MENIPMLKKRVLTERILIAADKDLKALWDELKRTHRVDVAEIARQRLREELAAVKSRVA